MLKQRYTREMVEIAVKQSRNLVGVLKLLGITNYSGGMSNYIHGRIKSWRIDIGHFTPHKGGTPKKSTTGRLTLREVDAPRQRAKELRAAMIDYGIPYACAVCTNYGVWNGAPLTLEIDHINNNRTDDRPENLRFLCPNCHTQRPLPPRATPPWLARVTKACPVCAQTFDCTQTATKTFCSRICGVKGRAKRGIKPSRTILTMDAANLTTAQNARKYSVSFNAAKKWLKSYNIRPRSSAAEQDSY